MGILSKTLNDTAVHWKNPVNDGRGKFTFDAAVEISVRWEFKQEKFMDADGEEKISHSVIFYDADVNLGEYLFLGALVDLDSSQLPDKQAGAFRIQQWMKIPDLFNKDIVRQIWL